MSISSSSKVLKKGFADALKKKEANTKKRNIENRLQGNEKKKIVDRVGYIRENGLDREDAALYNRDRNTFNTKVDQMIRKNEGEGMKKGKVYKNYALLRANRK